MRIMQSPRRLPILIGSAVVIAAVCYALAAAPAAQSAVPSPLLLGGCLVLLFAGTRFHVSIRLGAQRLELTWSEAGVVLALAIVPAPWVVLLTPVAVLLCFAGRQPIVRTIYNVAIFTVASAAAAGIVTAAAVSRPTDETDLLVLTAAGAASGLVTYLAVAVVIAVVQDVSLFATWRASGGLQVLTLAGNLGVAAAVLILARQDPRMLVVLPPLAFGLHQGYVGRMRGHEERKAGQRKSVAVSQLTADLDEPAVVRRAAEEICALTAADVVEVELTGDQDAPASLYRHHRNARPWIGVPADAPALPAALVAQVPIARAGRPPVGELRVWLAGGTTDLRLSEWDEEAVGILAATTAAALANARAHAEQIRRATTDRQTGLPTRPVLLDRIEASLRHPAGTSLPAVALVLVDITDFRDVVRALGHDTAEGLLARTAAQLNQASDTTEFLAHVGGDDFAVYLPDAGDPAHVRARALALLDAVAAPLQLPVGTVTLDAAAGIAYSSMPVARGGELLRQAMVALDWARRRDLRADFYDPGRDSLGGPAAVVMGSELHDALEHGQLELHYQPIVHLPSGAPVALEALVRWSHPTKGLLLPAEFMPVLEHSRDHARFVDWQLNVALQTRAMWSSQDLPISVNLAARCLLDTAFPARIDAALHSHGVCADQLMLELAETTTLTGSPIAATVLTELRELGVRIAIDGFGTGYSSLTGLLEVPATDVKIAAGFVRDMLIDDRAAGVVRMAVELGRLSNLRVIALGIPGSEHVDALVAAGCDAAQGHHLARPMLASELRHYLETAPAPPMPRHADIIHLGSRRRPTHSR